MKKLYAAVLAAGLLFANSALAMTDQEFEAIRVASDKFLSEVPENGYHLSADDVQKRILSGTNDFVVVDVRDKEEKFKNGHVPGSIYINFKEIAKSENLAKLPKDKDIILYCNTGHEQNKAVAALRMLGYKAYAMKFGYVAWKKEKPTDAMLAVISNADAKAYPVEK